MLYFLIIKLFIFNNAGMIFTDFINIKLNMVCQAVCKNLDNIMGYVNNFSILFSLLFLFFQFYFLCWEKHIFLQKNKLRNKNKYEADKIFCCFIHISQKGLYLTDCVGYVCVFICSYFLLPILYFIVIC